MTCYERVDSKPCYGIAISIEEQGIGGIPSSDRPWNGRKLAHVRKFVSGEKYEGPTKSGLAMNGDVMVSLIEALTKLRAEPPGAEEKQFARIHKGGDTDIAVTVIPPDDLKSLPSVDIREYVESAGYTGPTKKGVRFAWDKLTDFIGLLKVQAQELGAGELAQPILFPDARPSWVERSEEVGKPKPHGGDSVIQLLLPEGPKEFPGSFLDNSKGSNVLDLPAEPISAVVLPGGKHAVQSNFGFRHEVRNQTEANFILYAQLRGLKVVSIPTVMFDVFRTVKAYENYLRDLRRALLEAYERKSGHRPMAEHQTREAFKHYGLPWVE